MTQQAQESRRRLRFSLVFRLCRRCLAKCIPATIARRSRFSSIDRARCHAEFQVQFEGRLQVRHDFRRASVAMSNNALARYAQTSSRTRLVLVHSAQRTIAGNQPCARRKDRRARRSGIRPSCAASMFPFGYLQNQQPCPNRLAPRNLFTSREDQSPRRFRLPQLGGRIQSTAASMVSGGAENSVGRRHGNAQRQLPLALRREVVNDEQRILCMKSQGLECIPSGRPRARQVQPIHPRRNVVGAAPPIRS